MHIPLSMRYGLVAVFGLILVAGIFVWFLMVHHMRKMMDNATSRGSGPVRVFAAGFLIPDALNERGRYHRARFGLYVLAFICCLLIAWGAFSLAEAP